MTNAILDHHRDPGDLSPRCNEAATAPLGGEIDLLLDAESELQGLGRTIAGLMAELKRFDNGIRDSRRALDEMQRRIRQAEAQVQQLGGRLSQLGDVAQRDYLTGALNRRGLELAIQREFNRADRQGTVLAVAMLDIDHFKKLNDTLGHAAGDRALVHLADILASSLRSTDVLARFGGEEFVLLLPGSGCREAAELLDRIRHRLAEASFVYREHQVTMTFSAGVAERQVAEESETLLQRADAALYRAKQQGRNCVVRAVTDAAILH